MNLTSMPKNGRGCGFRKPGGVYLCCGTDVGGYPIEHFIKDPGIPWLSKISRAPTLLPRNPNDPNSVIDVYMVVSAKDYPSPWDHIEETKLHGLSKRIAPNFPFEQLTAGKSYINLIYPRGIPVYDFVCVDWEKNWHPKCKVYPGMVDIFVNEPPDKGHHPVLEEENEENHLHSKAFGFCTFAHKDLATLIHDENTDWIEDEHDITKCTGKVHFPNRRKTSFTYEGTVPVIAALNIDEAIRIAKDKDNYIPAVLLRLPVTHVEFIKEENTQTKMRANKAHFETYVVEE